MLRLAKPWADGDVTRGEWLRPNWSCSVQAWRGHRLPPAAQRLPGGSTQRRTKCQPSMKRKGISPSARARLPALGRAPARSPHAARIAQGSLPGEPEMMTMIMAISVSGRNGIS